MRKKIRVDVFIRRYIDILNGNSIQTIVKRNTIHSASSNQIKNNSDQNTKLEDIESDTFANDTKNHMRNVDLFDHQDTFSRSKTKRVKYTTDLCLTEENDFAMATSNFFIFNFSIKYSNFLMFLYFQMIYYHRR